MAKQTGESVDDGQVTFGKQTSLRLTDPVCGMDVNPEKTATKTTHLNGTTYFFCSDACKSAFEKNPTQFQSGAFP